MRQFVWCIPVAPTKLDETSIRIHELTTRVTDLPKGVVPVDFVVDYIISEISIDLKAKR
jgi:hypothetical protein